MSAAQAMPGTAVHPRWRGEHQVASCLQLQYSGSSPLARGALFDLSDEMVCTRFIPAGAGSTLYY